MKKTARRTISLFCFTVMMVLLSSSYLPLADANQLCPCDDLDHCVEWVSEGTISIKWGQIAREEINGEVYTFRADDFNEEMNAALISIEKGGLIRNEFLFLEGAYERQWFDWDNEVKVELTDITEDSHRTPSAKLKLYSRGRPELDIDLDVSSETIDGVDVSSEQYAPGEEKSIDVTVKNTGNAWIENIVLEIDIRDFRLKSKGDFEFRDQILKKNLGCLYVDESAELNFTVVAPEWDGKTSPYELVYYVNATAGGYDIKENYHSFDESLELGCTEPDMKVILEVVNEEINMSSWYAREIGSNTSSYNSIDFEIRDAWEYTFLRTKIFNTGLYAIDDIDVRFSEVPEELIISETYESGDHSYMDADGQYYLGQKLIPVRQGKYSFDKVVVETNFFGENKTWESRSQTLTVHGPYIVLDKVLSADGDDYTVSLDVLNDGDRAAWINLTDTIPDELDYVGGSLEKSLEGSDLPLSEWDFSTSVVNGTQFVSVDGVLLPPGSTLSLGYEFSSKTAPDLPPAVCEFRAIIDYEGEVQSSFYVDGNEVKQYWKPLGGGWVSESDVVEDLEDTASVPEQKEEQKTDEEDESTEDLHSVTSGDERLSDTSDVSVDVQQEPPTPSFLSKILDTIDGIFDKVQQFISKTFGSTLGGVKSVFGVAENAAIDAVENYLYGVVIIIAVIVFGVVYTLISK